MDLIHHVFLTRFNLPSAGVESRIRQQDEWLPRRVELFERFCVPSIRSQSNQNFSWLIYFDPQSPSWLRERTVRYAADGLCTPIFRESVDRDQLLSDIRSGIESERPVLITTNLDNDDGLATDFVERLQSVRTPHSRAAVYLANGLIRNPEALYLRRDRRNAFCSVRESAIDPVTCWSDWHNLLGRSMPVVELGGSPAWLQVVHGENVSNRVRGRLVSPARYRQSFGALLDDSTAPTQRRLVVDRLIEGPRRACREAFRAIAKWIIMTVLGKNGLDRVKSLGRVRLSGGRPR